MMMWEAGFISNGLRPRVAPLVILSFALGLAASAGASAPSPLLPLIERDQTDTRETGCTCAFTLRRDALVQMVGHELMLRTRGGRQVCRISDAQFGAFSDARGALACGGLRLSLKRTGRVRQHPEADSSEGPAALTVRQARSSRVLAGNWGCAC